MAVRYRLWLRDVRLGDVEQTEADFPSLWGTFHPSDATDHPEVRARFAEYHAFSVVYNRLMLAEDYAGFEVFIGEHEASFLDLIESTDWSMEDAKGKRTPILVPLFSDDSGVTWRWDFGR